MAEISGMKKNFYEYYLITEKETEVLLKNAIFVLDTNVLLNFYRYSSLTVEKYLELLFSIKGRLWMPFQIGREFHNNRYNEIIRQKKIYSDYIKKVKSLKDDFKSKSRNPFIPDEYLEYLELIITDLCKSERNFDTIISSDNVLNDLNEIYKDNVGESYTIEELNEIYSEGKQRYKDKVPPGYMDEKNKPLDNRKYGDLILWKEILEKATKDKKDIIFITSENKEDWWDKMDNNKIISPHPSLRKEFREVTGQNYYSFQPFRFLELSKKFLQFDIKKEVIDEVKTNDNNNYYTILLTVNYPEEIQWIKDRLETLGYDFMIKEIENNNFQIVAQLPDIPDLRRKLNDRILKIQDEFRKNIVT